MQLCAQSCVMSPKLLREGVEILTLFAHLFIRSTDVVAMEGDHLFHGGPGHFQSQL